MKLTRKLKLFTIIVFFLDFSQAHLNLLKCLKKFWWGGGGGVVLLRSRVGLVRLVTKFAKALSGQVGYGPTCGHYCHQTLLNDSRDHFWDQIDQTKVGSF